MILDFQVEDVDEERFRLQASSGHLSWTRRTSHGTIVPCCVEAPHDAGAGQITSNRRLDDGIPQIGAASCRITIQRHFSTLTV